MNLEELANLIVANCVVGSYIQLPNGQFYLYLGQTVEEVMKELEVLKTVEVLEVSPGFVDYI